MITTAKPQLPRVVDLDVNQARHEPRMAFLGHLGELRRRLLWSLGALTVTSGTSFFFAPSIFELLRRPMAGLPAGKLVVLGPLEMLITYIKLALMCGLMFSAPVMLLQLWLFVAPGLYPSERRWVLPFVLCGSIFFVGGAAFCFLCVLPASFAYLVDMVPLSVEAHYSVASYFSLVIQLMLAFGAIFELPLIMVLLSASGLTTPDAMRKFRGYWVIIAFIIGGVLTPTPDPLTQSMMAGPLIVFFELGIMGSQLVVGRRRRVSL